MSLNTLIKKEIFFTELLKLLKLDPKNRFYSDNGEILRNKVYESAMKMDSDLIKLLLSSERMKQKFFTKVDDILVFDKISFGWAINNKAFLQDSYTRFKNTIGLIDSKEQFISSKNDVVLSFPYKDCILEGGQTKEDQKRGEIFYNELLAPDDVDRLLAPKVFTNVKRYTKDGEESITEFKDDDNLLIKGNNLLALSSILKRYEGRVKCIYIDPPYYFNKTTETDAFKYNSNFHMSTWLAFMKNRLEIAKKMLCEGGTIWISISDDGMHYLKVMADDIFGKEHFVATLPRRTRNGKSDVPFNLSQDFDWLLCYTNVTDKTDVVGRVVNRKYYETPDFPGRPWRISDLTTQKVESQRPNSAFDLVDPKTKKVYKYNPKRLWGITKDTFQEYYDRGAIVFPDDYAFLNITVPYSRKFKEEDDRSGKLSAVISDFQIQDFLSNLMLYSKNKDGNEQIERILGNEKFNYAKPENLVKSIIEVCTKEHDIVLDFFMGSSTTQAVSLKMNRQFIGIEQMEYIDTVSVERLKATLQGEQGGISEAVNWQGGGSFVYCELKELNHKYIDEIQVADDSKLNELYKEITTSEFISYKADINKLKESEQDFKELTTEDKRNFLIQVLDKNLLYVNYCDMEDEDLAVTEEEKAFARSFYGEDV